MNSRASYQSHKGLSFGPKDKAKRLRFFDRATSETTFKPLESRYLRAIARGIPNSNPTDILIRLVQGESLDTSWVNDKTFRISLV